MVDMSLEVYGLCLLVSKPCSNSHLIIIETSLIMQNMTAREAKYLQNISFDIRR